MPAPGVPADTEGSIMSRPVTRPGRPAAVDLAAAAVLGAGIALSLSTLMLVAKLENVSGPPDPLAVAFAARLFGKATLGTALLPVGLLLHAGYVTTATVAAVAVLRRPLRPAAALSVALGLWVLAGVIIVPYVGWGLFGAGLGAAAVLNILAVHILYGAFLSAGSWLAFRGSAAGPPPSERSPAPGTRHPHGRARAKPAPGPPRTGR
jgi:hypothetical protein